MKKATSPVWKFFERVITPDNRCVAVVCKLCENQYKFFGNTTNLRVHLANKHPIQWDLSEHGNLIDSSHPLASVSKIAKADVASPRKKKHATRSSEKNVGYSVSISNDEDSTAGAMPRIEIQRVDVLRQNSDSDQDDDATTMNMVRQMHGDENSAEEWLEEDPYQITHIETYEPKQKRRRMKYHKIKREVQSPTDLPGYYVAPTAKRSFEEPQVRKDEYTIFGEYVANKLRKLKAPRTRGNLQQLITTLLWQAEYGMYDSADAVKRVLMIPVSPEHDPEIVTNANVVPDFDQTTMETIIDTTELIQNNEGETTE